jgi:hypothetical protein
MQPCQFQCRLIGFCPAVAEKAFASEGPFAEQFCQFALRLGVKRIIDVKQQPCLFSNRFNDFRMTMSDAADGPAWKHIQYFIAVGIIDITAFAFDYDSRQPRIIGNNVFVKQIYYFLRSHYF